MEEREVGAPYLSKFQSLVIAGRRGVRRFFQRRMRTPRHSNLPSQICQISELDTNTATSHFESRISSVNLPAILGWLYPYQGANWTRQNVPQGHFWTLDVLESTVAHVGVGILRTKFRTTPEAGPHTHRHRTASVYPPRTSGPRFGRFGALDREGEARSLACGVCGPWHNSLIVF